MKNKKPQSSSYFSIGQLRLDHWNELKNECSFLARGKPDSKLAKQHKARIEELLDHLKTVERYYTFPGSGKVEKLRHMLVRGEFTALAHNVAAMARQEITSRYCLSRT